MSREGSRSFQWLVLALVLLHILPIWLFEYIPTQDGPCHLETAYTFSHYSDAGSEYSRYYVRNIAPVPSWISHLLLGGSMRILAPRVAEKVLLTIYVFLFVGAVHYLLSAVDRRKTFYVLAGFPFIYNHLLHVGFYSFVISVPLSLMIVAWWWKQEDPLQWRTILLLDLFLVLLYFCHLVSVVIVWLVLPILGVFRHRLRIKELARLALGLLPSVVLPLHFLQTWGTGVSHFGSPFPRLRELASLGPLASFSPGEHRLGQVLGLVIAGLIIHTVRSHRRHALESTSSKSVRFAWAGSHATQRGFLVAALSCVGVLLIAPESVSEGGFVVDRVMLYPFLFLLPWLEPGFRRVSVKRAVGSILVVLSLAHLWQTARHYERLGADLREYTSGIPFVHPNDTILPIHFDGSTTGREFESSYRIGVLWHAVGHYCTDAGAIGLFNIHGNKKLFPVSYKAEMHPFHTLGDLRGGNVSDIYPARYAEPIDVILVWGWPGDLGEVDGRAELERLTRNHRLVHQTPRLRLYRLKAAGKA